MDGITIPTEALSHPVVMWAFVAVVVVTLIASKIWPQVSPLWVWWQGRHERKYQRQLKIATAAAMVTDAHAEALRGEISDLREEIVRQRRELITQRDEERARADRLESELREVRFQLEQALLELRQWRQERDGDA